MNPREPVRIHIGQSILELVEGDITNQEVDAIINAANAQLAGGGGVDGAIHRAGGPEIMTECRAIGGCPTGQAVATGAGRLKARKVIHAVAPIYRDGKHGEPALLASAYTCAFGLAADQGLQTVAAPSLGTGAYAYPIEEAAKIALGTALSFLETHPELTLIRFVLLGQESLRAYATALNELAPTQRLRLS